MAVRKLKDAPPVEGLSKAKAAILRMLWAGEWVSGKAIFRKVQQTYYDRRIRELKDDYGWDIVVTWVKPEGSDESEIHYRLKSHIQGEGHKRHYLSAADRQQVLERDQHTCQICGAKENLQIDHKVPLIRKGATTIENMQVLCNECNVDKRGTCRRCRLISCDLCPLAYPEVVATRLIVSLDRDLKERIESLARESGIPLAQQARILIERGLKSFQ